MGDKPYIVVVPTNTIVILRPVDFHSKGTRLDEVVWWITLKNYIKFDR